MKKRQILYFLLIPGLVAVVSCGMTPNGNKEADAGKASATAKAWNFDFGSGPVAPGYVGLGAKDSYDAAKGYGWTEAPDDVRDRKRPDDAVRRDFIYSRSPGTFRLDVPPGMYAIFVMMGDSEYGDHLLAVSIPGVSTNFPVLEAKRAEYATLIATVETSGSGLEFHFNSPENNWVLNSLSVEPATEAISPGVDRFQLESKDMYPDEWGDVFAWPDPIAPYLAQFRKNMALAKEFQPTGLSRADYIDLIQGNVDFFKQHQDEKGAIIDPYRNEEYQYATPCFALSAATLVVHAGRQDLVEPAAKAMDWATWTLSQGQAATHHEDFFAPQIAHGMLLLKPYVSAERYAKWEANIRGFDPYAIYRAACGRGNWNVVALSGDGLFFLMGLRKTPDYTLNCLAGQGRLFNSPWGMYTEGPMPYDHFPRIWAADLLAAGFQGRNTDKLAEVLRRGALTSLFLQSPTGELPAGGRSAHHQWNEAEQCLTYEIYAAKELADGDEEMAGVFKRAAHLALGSIRRWQRPSGELWIVKNRADPADFLGYESYSSHSQYNLLAMAMLSIAFPHAEATESVPERPAPADVGGFVVHVPAPFNKIIANAGGMYVELDHAADLAYNATGLIRVHRAGFNPQLGPSDGLSAREIYHVPEKPTVTTGIGSSWPDPQGQWHTLGEFGFFRHGENIDLTPTVEVRDVSESPERVAFEVVYTGDFHGPATVIERYVITPDGVDQTVVLEGYSGPMRMVWPVLAFDGEKETEIRTDGNTVRVKLGDDTQAYESKGAVSVRVDPERQAYRNGWARIAVAEYPETGKATLSIRPVQSH